FGRTNPTHPHSWLFVDQPFAIGRVFGAEGNRGLGVEGSVLLPLPWFVEVVASSNGIGGEATNRSWLDAADDGIGSPADLHSTTAIKQFFPLSDDWSLAWGLSYAGAPNGTGRGNRAEVFGTDVYLRWRPITEGSYAYVTLESEWLYRRRQIPSDVLADWTSYTQLGWRFARRWGAGARWEYGTPAKDLEGVVGADPLDPEWTRDRHRTSVDVSFWPSHFSRLRVQTAADALGADPVDLSAFVQFEVLTGAHGAHTF
ncbi:MAG: zinc-regulated TonB-dependent outer membrane receptor, partial [Myxococcota bacterium]